MQQLVPFVGGFKSHCITTKQVTLDYLNSESTEVQNALGNEHSDHQLIHVYQLRT